MWEFSWDIQWMVFAMLFMAGIASSIINMLAGGGSMLSLGLMMMMGIDPIVANGTNRVGVLVSTGSGAAAYQSEHVTEWKDSLRLGVWSIPGALLGAWVSVSISSDAFEKILGIVMIGIIISLFSPKKKEITKTDHKISPWTYPAMTLVGFYGGAIQVGVGITIFAVLRHIAKMDVMRINMHRIFIVLIFVVPVLGVFLIHGKVNWMYAIVLCAGNAIGSWATVKFALKKGEKVVKAGLVVASTLMAAQLLFAQ